MRFAVSPAVLIPRPDTEALVDLVVRSLSSSERDGGAFTFYDMGAGSGCIGASLLKEFPASQLVAVDVSAEAIRVAQENLKFHGLLGRAQFVCQDMTTWTLPRTKGPAKTVVVSNPPYVASAAISSLDTEVRCFEPRLALDGGSDGLSFYRHLARSSAGADAVFLEVGHEQFGAVADIFSSPLLLLLNDGHSAGTRWSLTDVQEDLQGIPRALGFRPRRQVH